MWGIWKRLYSINNTGCRGQAVLELAIFGSFLIMLLGILINYGLRYDSQQEVTQQAFRKALASSFASLAQGNVGLPISTTHVIVTDKYIPDPYNSFAFGSTIPASSSASVIASYKLDEDADTDEEKDHVYITINNQTSGYLSDDIKNAKQTGKPGGLQPDYTETTTENTTMAKNENSSSIDTTDNASFSNTIQRQITHSSGGSIATDTVDSTISQSINQQWQTAWGTSK